MSPGSTPRASLVWLSLTVDERAACCTWDDDGVGPRALVHGSGLLEGWADRVDALGGLLDVSRRPGGGTRLQAAVPYAGARMGETGGEPQCRLPDPTCGSCLTPPVEGARSRQQWSSWPSSWPQGARSHCSHRRWAEPGWRASGRPARSAPCSSSSSRGAALVACRDYGLGGASRPRPRRHRSVQRRPHGWPQIRQAARAWSARCAASGCSSRRSSRRSSSIYRVRTLRADASRRRSAWALLALYVVVAIAAVGRSLTFRTDSRHPTARRSALGGGQPPGRARGHACRGNLHNALGAIATVVGGIVSAASATWRLGERRVRRRRVALVLVPTIVVGIALAWTSVDTRLAMVPDDLRTIRNWSGRRPCLPRERLSSGPESRSCCSSRCAVMHPCGSWSRLYPRPRVPRASARRWPGRWGTIDCAWHTRSRGRPDRRDR